MANSKPKAATKTEVYAALAEKTGMTKKQVGAFMDTLSEYIKAQLGKKGPGLFVIPGMMKVKKVIKEPTPERQGRNPKTGEPMVIKAKPRRTIVKVLALKALKESVK
jgi:nucleoid DNA-binding protein